MPGLVPGIHVFLPASKTWMAGTSPAMTTDRSLMAPPQNPTSIRAVFAALFLALWLAALDQTVVSTALPTMVGELGGLAFLSWVVTAYLLTSTVVGPLYGKFGDLYGRKIVLQVAISVF